MERLENGKKVKISKDTVLFHNILIPNHGHLDKRNDEKEKSFTKRIRRTSLPPSPTPRWKDMRREMEKVCKTCNTLGLVTETFQKATGEHLPEGSGGGESQ